MASAVLATRNEHQWGDRDVYMRKNPISNHNNLPKLGSLVPNSFPNPNPSYGGDHAHSRDVDIDSEETPAAAGIGASAAISDGCSSFSRKPTAVNYSAGKRNGEYVSYDVTGFSGRERRDLKRRLVSELEQVRAVVGRIESRAFPGGRPSDQSAKATAGGTDHASKVLSTPPLSHAAKKVKSAMMKRCGGILTKLMKHKAGIWFNAPVDVEGMGLHDYHQIIKNPMDLGTVKTKLRKSAYQTPMDFAADVRLTFNNALVYNPRGHVVHDLAAQLLRVFDGLFIPANQKYEKQMEIASCESTQHHVPHHQHGRSLPWPPAKDELAPVSLPPAPSESSGPAHSMAKQSHPPASAGRISLAKQPKPKARDPNKRKMSLEEREKLGEGLQSLPPEKMDLVEQILRRRNGVVQAEDGQIELDFDQMDNETLWELDRFVSNYKKTISKMKRLEAVASAQPSFPVHIPSDGGDKPPIAAGMHDAATVGKNRKGDPADEDVDIGEDMPATNYPPVEIDKNDDDTSSSSSSSGSDSSSSSDSDSDSTSDSGSDEVGGGAKSPQ